MSEPLLSIKDLHAYYGASHVLQGVSLEVKTECLALLGRNGMGKSTLLRSVMGLTPPRRTGELKFLGNDVSKLMPHRIAQLGLAYVPQGRRLFPSLSVHEHLAIAFRTADGRKDWSPERVYDLFPEIARRRRIAGTRLSGGEQQMLAIGRALVTNPRLLLMDEPSEGLAPVVVKRLLNVTAELVRHGIGVLLVEQNLRAAQLAATRVAVLVTGKVVLEAAMEEFAEDDEAKRKHLGV
jgi:branched-chain amino acid transport system ATP-binding protein